MSFCGVCSISFRNRSVSEIIAAVKAVGLDGIEWGSDVHVKPGDPALARQVRAQMDDAGLRTLSYGTYFGLEELELANFREYLDTAALLGTDTLRIWPPKKHQRELTAIQYNIYIEFARTVATMAKAMGMTLGLERHPGMLTERAEDALQFLADVGMDNLRMYWQPVQFADPQTNLESARQLASKVDRVHVFHWQGENRYPLAQGMAEWKTYIPALKDTATAYLLEFMPDDRLETLAAEAQALKAITSYR